VSGKVFIGRRGATPFLHLSSLRQGFDRHADLLNNVLRDTTKKGEKGEKGVKGSRGQGEKGVRRGKRGQKGKKGSGKRGQAGKRGQVINLITLCLTSRHSLLFGMASFISFANLLT